MRVETSHGLAPITVRGSNANFMKGRNPTRRRGALGDGSRPELEPWICICRLRALFCAAVSFSAMILAAGWGTRLAPISDEIPKPLVPVGDRPLLISIVEKLLELGAFQVSVNAHYLWKQIDKNIKDLFPFVHVLHEECILGTAGGLLNAHRALGTSALLLVNGDIWGPLPVVSLLRNAGPGLTLAVHPARPREGTIGLGQHGEVVRLRGEIFGREVSSGNYMGVAHAGPSCLAALPGRGCLIGDYALPWLRGGGHISTVSWSEPFVDVGTIPAYLFANLKWLEARVGPDPSQCFVGEGARISAEVTCRQSVIGASAEVVGSGALTQCVVLPGALAHAPLTRCIVLRSGKVVPVGSPAPD